MKVSIIGSGNVATHIAKALHQAGIEITAIWSYTPKNAVQLALQIKGVKAVKNIAEMASIKSDFLIISVKDDAIEEVAEQLITYDGIVAHTSGSVSIEALGSLKNYGVFYPLQTFSKHKEVNFKSIPLCLEAKEKTTLQALTTLALLLSEKVHEVNSEKRRILHLSSVFACNFPNYMYSIAQNILQQHELDFDLIKPLINETAQKVQTALPAEVQTGPAVRNDQKTMAKHEELLKLMASQWLEIYRLLSGHIKNNK